tara:strand:+ start:485 stop:1081 length:597 start_codon:yes stop_codon:yes gene_type:complete
MVDNIISQNYYITNDKRNHANKYLPHLIWLTGISGSGKSTIANELEKSLFKKGVRTFVLDGDNIRLGLNKDLSFSDKDRSENIRRVAEVSKLMLDAGIVVIAAFISPFCKDRANVKSIVNNRYVEVFINTSLEECQRRDVKGLYKKVREGKIKEFTGFSSKYEIPKNPDLEILTEKEELQISVNRILKLVESKLRIDE